TVRLPMLSPHPRAAAELFFVQACLRGVREELPGHAVAAGLGMHHELELVLRGLRGIADGALRVQRLRRAECNLRRCFGLAPDHALVLDFHAPERLVATRRDDISRIGGIAAADLARNTCV